MIKLLYTFLVVVWTLDTVTNFSSTTKMIPTGVDKHL